VNGVDVSPKYTLAEKKAFCHDALMHFSPSERRLINPHYYKVDISDDLYNLKMGIINRIVKEIKEFEL
jgi:nicotinate phosphoribosyltransferase